jgi:endoglucanase
MKMKSMFVAVIGMLALDGTLWAATKQDSVAADPVTAVLPRMQPGICVGHFDHDDDMSETASLNAAYLDSVKAAGFKSIRFFHSTQKPPVFYEANIRYALDAGLVVNLCVFANGANTKSAEDFVRHWRSIAEHYRDFPPALVFELFNEPALSPKLKDNAEVMRWINAAIAAIREVSPRRVLLVGGPQFMQSQFLSHVTPEHLTYRLPDGSGFAGDKHLIGAFHMYEPHNYTMPKGKLVTLADLPRWKEQITENLDRAAAWSAKWAKPVVMTEWASQSEPKDRADFLAYTRFVKGEAAKRGIGWMYYCGVPRGYLAYLGPVMNWSILDTERGWDQDALDILTGVKAPPAPAFNLIRNSEFVPGFAEGRASRITGWRAAAGATLVPTRDAALSGRNAAQIVLDGKDAAIYQDASTIQLQMSGENSAFLGASEAAPAPGIRLRKGSAYRLTFLARAEKPGATATARLEDASQKNTVCFTSKPLPLATHKQEHVVEYTHTGADIMNARVSLSLSGGANTVFVDRVLLKGHRTTP